LKRAATADGKHAANSSEQAIHLTQLPHLMTTQAIEDRFPRVQPVSEDYGEEDVPVEEELGDPVPRLTRRTVTSTRAPVARAGDDERGGSRVRAYLVADASCPSDMSGHVHRGAAPVGRCLGRHSPTYHIAASTDDSTASTDDRGTATAEHATATADSHATATADSSGRHACRPMYISAAIARRGIDPL
jgi:hypothetical protein